MKAVDFSEAIGASDLKVGRSRQLIELMKICEYSMSRSFLHIDPRLFTYENQNSLFSEIIGPFSTKFLCKLLGTRNWKFINMMLVT